MTSLPPQSPSAAAATGPGSRVCWGTCCFPQSLREHFPWACDPREGSRSDCGLRSRGLILRGSLPRLSSHVRRGQGCHDPGPSIPFSTGVAPRNSRQPSLGGGGEGAKAEERSYISQEDGFQASSLGSLLPLGLRQGQLPNPHHFR